MYASLFRPMAPSLLGLWSSASFKASARSLCGLVGGAALAKWRLRRLASRRVR